MTQHLFVLQPEVELYHVVHVVVGEKIEERPDATPTNRTGRGRREGADGDHGYADRFRWIGRAGAVTHCVMNAILA